MTMDTSGATARHARIAARRMSYATLAAGAMLGSGFAYLLGQATFNPGWVAGLIAARHPGLGAAYVGPPVVFMAIAWMLAQAAVLAVALHAIWRAFRVLADRDGLTPEAGHLLQRAGLAFAASAGLVVLATPVLSLAASLNAPAGQRFLSLSVGSSEVLTLLMAGVLMALGHTLRLAAEIDEDHRQIV